MVIGMIIALIIEGLVLIGISVAPFILSFSLNTFIVLFVDVTALFIAIDLIRADTITKSKDFHGDRRFYKIATMVVLSIFVMISLMLFINAYPAINSNAVAFNKGNLQVHSTVSRYKNEKDYKYFPTAMFEYYASKSLLPTSPFVYDENSLICYSPRYRVDGSTFIVLRDNHYFNVKEHLISHYPSFYESEIILSGLPDCRNCYTKIVRPDGEVCGFNKYVVNVSENDPKVKEFVSQFKPLFNSANVFERCNGSNCVIYAVIPDRSLIYASFHNFKIEFNKSEESYILKIVKKAMANYLIPMGGT